MGKILDPSFKEVMCKEIFKQVNSYRLFSLKVSRARFVGLLSLLYVMQMRTKAKNGDNFTLKLVSRAV